MVTTGKTADTDAMEIGVGFDDLNYSNKRVKRSSTGTDSVESSARKDHLVEAIDASAPDLGMRPSKPRRCKIGTAAKGNSVNPIWQPESSRSSSYSLEKRHSLVAQKRAGNESGKREVIISPDLGNSSPFQRRYMKKKPEPTNLSSRPSLFGKEVLTIAEEQGSFESYQNLGLQKAQDFKINMNQLSHTNSKINKEKLYSSYLPEWMHETDIEDKGNENVIGKCPRITTPGHISNPHHDQAFPDPVVSKRNHSCKKHANGKRKCNSLSCNFGETSVSTLNQASHAGISNLKPDMSNENGFHGTALIEIDKLYPEARCCNSYGQQSGVSDNSSARASQIESDEIFARELQEQFDLETTRFIGMDKVDATIAGSLQQDENEDEYTATLSQNRHSKSARIDEIKFKLEYEADIRKRLDLYEEWEDLVENNDTRENDDLSSNHSFNNTDYAMQYDSDDSDDGGHQHVDSSVINELPLILVQNNNDKEACAVCLETLAVGETMRYLPCLHKFHKMCIDTWLKIKPACPVCKFKIALH